MGDYHPQHTAAMKLAGAYINDGTYERLVALAAANNRTLAGQCRHLFDRALSGDLKVPRLPRAPSPAAGALAQAVAKPGPQAAATPGAATPGEEAPAGALPGVPHAAQPGVPPPPLQAVPGAPCGAVCCGRLSTHPLTMMTPPAPAECRPPGVPPVCRAPAHASAMPQDAVPWHAAAPCPAAALTCPGEPVAAGAMPRAAMMQHAVAAPGSETLNAEGRAVP